MEGGSTGYSLYVGSLQAPANNTQQSEDEEEAQERKQRDEEMGGLLVHVFDDLDQTDSELHESTCHINKSSSDDRYRSSIDTSQQGNIPEINEHIQHQRYAQAIYHPTQGAYQPNVQNFNPPSVVSKNHVNTEDNVTSCSIEDGDMSDRSITPWSEGSPALVSVNYDTPLSDINPPGVRLNLHANNDSFIVSDSNCNGNVMVNASQEENRTNCNAGIQDSMSDIHSKFLPDDNKGDQLKILYEARGRELDRLCAEYELIRAEKLQQTSALQHENVLLTGEKEQLEVSRSQLQILLTEKDRQIRSLTSDFDEVVNNFSESKSNVSKLRSKLESSEILIKTLEQNISDLQSADSLAKSRKMHESFITKLQGNHKTELTNLRSKLSSTAILFQEEEHKVSELRAELQLCREKQDCFVMEKSRVISCLQTELLTCQQQCNTLLASSSDNNSIESLTEENTLLMESHKLLQQELLSTKSLLAERKEDLQNYDMALKLGLFSSEMMPNDSMAQLKLKENRALTYDETLPNTENSQVTKDQSSPQLKEEELIKKLQTETQRALYALKRRGEELANANKELSTKSSTILKMKSQKKSLIADVTKHQAMVEQLKSETQSLRYEIAAIQSICICKKNNLLKQELSSALSHVSTLQVAGHRLDSVLQVITGNSDGDLNELHSAIESHTKALIESKQVNQDLCAQLKTQNLELEREKQLLVYKIDEIITVLNSIKEKMRNNPCNEFDDQQKNQLQNLLHEFMIQASKIRTEQSELLEIQLNEQNDLETVKISLIKSLDDNQIKKEIISKLQKDLLEERENREQLSTQSLDICKESYLKYHGEAVNGVRDDYSRLRIKLEEKIESLKSELTEVKAQYLSVCKERNDLEAQLSETKYVNNREKRSSDMSKDQVQLAINAITHRHDQQILLLKKSHAIEIESYARSNIEVEIKSIQPEGGEEHSEQMPTQEHNSLEILVQNLGLQLSSINDKLKQEVEDAVHTESGEKMQEIAECLESYREKFEGIEQQFGLVRSGSNSRRDKKYDTADVSLNSDASFFEKAKFSIVEDYKKCIEKLKIKNMNVREMYENKFKCLQEEHEIISQSNKDIVSEALEMKRQQKNIDQQLKHREIMNLTNVVSSLQRQMQLISSDHEKTVSKLSDEVQSLESDVKEAMHARTLEQNRFQQDFERVKLEISISKEEIIVTKKKLSDTQEAAAQRKTYFIDKYRKLERNYNKLKSGSEERIEHYKCEAKRLYSESENNRKSLLTGMDSWVEETRRILSLGVTLVLKGLQLKEGQTSLAQAALQDPIKTLNAMLKTMQDFALDPTLLDFKTDGVNVEKSKETKNDGN